MKKTCILLFGLSVSALLAFYAFRAPNYNTLEPSFGIGEKMKGLCWVGGDSVAAHNITQVTAINANWISQTPFGWMNGHQDDTVHLNNKRAWWGEADRGVGHTTKLAKDGKVKTMLKPHIWIMNSGDKWRSDIEMKSAEDWKIWFASYTDWIMHYAHLAEEHQMESLCIGTELQIATRDFPEEWRKIIKSVRGVYSGELTYAANWYKEYEDITFWDDLDYIGIQAYFPLSSGDNPNKKSLIKEWKKHKKAIEKVSSKYKKAVVFTEIGYKNTADAAKEPWTWPQNMDHDIEVSEETQINCYEALFEATWNEDWMKGIFIWKWFPTSYKHKDYKEYFEYRRKRRAEWYKKKDRKLGPPVYFSPQAGEALNVLSAWYAVGE